MAVSLPAAFPFTEIKITALSSTDYMAAWTWTRRQRRAKKHCLQSAPFPYRTGHVQMNQIRTRCDFTKKQSLGYITLPRSQYPPSMLKIQKTYSRLRGRISKAPKQVALPFLYHIIYTSYNYASD